MRWRRDGPEARQCRERCREVIPAAVDVDLLPVIILSLASVGCAMLIAIMS